MTREQAVSLIIDEPVEIGHILGFEKLSEIHNKWLREMISGTKSYTLQASRGSYKTTCVSIALACILLLYPRRRVLFLRKTDTDVREITSQVKKILQSKLFKVLSASIWGNIPFYITTSNMNELNTSLNADTKGTPQLTALGIGGNLTGKHFDDIFPDDIVTIKDRISGAEREFTKIVFQELQNVLNRGGRIFSTGTPWHKDDAFSLMSNIHKFDCYQCGVYTDDEIEKLKKSMSRSLFSANYELKYIADEDVLFSDPKYTDSSDPDLLRDGLCHIDASYGGEDGTAFTIAKRSEGGLIYVLGKLWHAHVDNCIPQILDLKRRYMAGRTYCEDNGDKGYLKKRLKEFGDNATSYHESMNKFVKISTILYKDWENIRFLPDSDEEYIAEIADYSENAEHDDAPDSLASLLRVIGKKTNSSDENYISVFG